MTFRDILAVLRIARVALIIGLLAALGIYLPEQSAELFRIMTDELGMQIILFAGATVFAAVALWSWSDRLLDLLPASLRRGPGVGSTMARVLPIGLGLLPIMVAVLMLLAVVTGGGRSPAGKFALCAGISTFGAAAALLIQQLWKENRRDAAARITAVISAGQFLIFCFLPPGARSYGLFEFDLRKRQVPLPLGWILSQSARQEMIAQISTSGLAKRVPGSRTWNCNGEENYCELQRVPDVLRARKL